MLLYVLVYKKHPGYPPVTRKREEHKVANNLFGGLGNLGDALGGIVSGLAKSGLAPQDDPGVKLINSQAELSELQRQEAELLVEIGRQAFERNPAAWPQQQDKLNLIRSNMATAEGQLRSLKAEQEAAQQEKEAQDAKGRCPSCGHANPDGIKFCQECGTKLGSSACPSCGAQLQPGVRFCGECGARLDG